MGDSVKSLTEVKADNIHYSALIYQAYNFIVEGYQAGQAWLPLGEAMMTPPNNLLVLYMPGNDSQD